MSYCRWSDNDFKCDLYCYYGGNYITHVAENKIVFEEELPPHIELSEDNIEKYLERYKKVMDIVHESKHVKIELPYSGQTFQDDSMEEFLVTVKMLKETGYNVPDWVIQNIEEEMEELNGGDK